jgi:hypothetical protein
MALHGIELSLRDVLSRIPRLESLYRQTFGVEAQTNILSLETGVSQDESDFRIRIDDAQLFTDRESLRQIVRRWRTRFPFLNVWRLHSAQHGWGNSIIYFRNVHNLNIDEFSEEYLGYQNETFEELALAGDANVRFPLQEGFQSIAGGYSGGRVYGVSPIGNLYISEFSIQYLALFLLSSLMRYRPQTWTHAISRSVVPGEVADDKTLSLIERFLDLNEMETPDIVVQILNPYEDDFA